MLQINSREPIRLAGVIFDVDDTLVASEELTQQMLCRAAASLGHTLDESALRSMIGRSWKDVEALVGAAIADDLASAAILKKCNLLLEEHLSRGTPARTEGADEILNWLEEVRLPKAIASSADRAWIDLVLGDVRRRFEVVVANEDVVEVKPSPEVFLSAAAGIGVAPRDCVVIGDSENDVIGARRAGMTPIIVPGRARPAPRILQMAHAVADSLRDVKNYLGEIWNARLREGGEEKIK